MTNPYNDVRRIETVIHNATQMILESFVFEFNDSNTWDAVTAMTNKFLNNIWLDGALQGSTAAQAYQILCGLGSSMTQQDIESGILKVVIKAAVTHPGEFIIIENQIEVASK